MSSLKVHLKKIIAEIVKDEIADFGVHIQFLNEANIPEELLQKVSDITRRYMDGEMRWLSVEDVFDEIVIWVSDPMEAVTIVYNKLNVASRGGPTSDPGTPVPSVLKRKARKAYDQLMDLAQMERIKKKRAQ